MPLRISVPEPAAFSAPLPLKTPESANDVPALSILMPAVPPRVKGKVELGLAVVPVYSKVAVLPLEPRLTLVGAPRGLLVLTLAMEAICVVPAASVGVPVKVLVPERISVPEPSFSSEPAPPLIAPPMVSVPVPI